MVNAYLIDAIISALWLLVMLVGWHSINRQLKALNERITPEKMALAISALTNQAFILAMPITLLALFAVWRFYGLLLTLKALGAGAYGLMAILVVLSAIEALAYLMLTLVASSGYARPTINNGLSMDILDDDSAPLPPAKSAADYWRAS